MRAIGSAVTSSELEGARGERAVIGGRIARPGLDSSDDARFRRGDEPVLPRRADLHSLTDAHGQLDAVFRLGMETRNRGCVPPGARHWSDCPVGALSMVPPGPIYSREGFECAQQRRSRWGFLNGVSRMKGRRGWARQSSSQPSLGEGRVPRGRVAVPVCRRWN